MAELEQIARDMLRHAATHTFTGDTNGFVRELPRGLSLVCLIHDGQWIVSLTRPDVAPSPAEIGIVRAAFNVPDVALERWPKPTVCRLTWPCVADAALGPEGIVAKSLPGYEHREAQIHMARLVELAALNGWPVVAEAGTGTGKCVKGDTLITLADGTRRRIADLVGLSFVTHQIGIDYKARWGMAERCFASGVKPVYRVTTQLGHTITASADHPFLTVIGWKRLQELAGGECVAVARYVPSPLLTEPLPGAEIRFLAHMIADGSCTGHNGVSYIKADTALVQDWQDAVRGLDNALPTQGNRKMRYGIRRETLMEHRRNGAIVALEKHGVLGKLSKEKTIPDAVFRLPNHQLALFIGRLFSGDGHVSKERNEIEYTSASQTLIRQLQYLLLRFGIVSRLAYKAAPLNGKVFDAWRITITGADSIRRFAATVGAQMIGAKRQKLDTLLLRLPEQGNPNNDLIPAGYWPRIHNARRERGVSLYALRQQVTVSADTARGISRAKLQEIAAVLDNDSMAHLAQSDVYWDRIVSIESAGTEPTYDITMIGEPNFMGNAFIVHNSLAYLAPLVLLGKKVIVSTANKALQAQLWAKDVPFLQAHLRPFAAALAKGRGNYVCNRKAEDGHGNMALPTPELAAWYAETETGDLEEFPAEITPEQREMITVDDHGCLGRKLCPLYHDCWYYAAKRQRADAQVIITNHALLCLHKQHETMGILPDADVLVVDEAHQLAQYAINAQSAEINVFGVKRIAKLLERRQAGIDPDLQGVARAFPDRAVQFLDETLAARIPDGETQGGIRREQEYADGLDMAGTLDSIAYDLWSGDEDPETEDEKKLQNDASALTSFADKIRRLASPTPPGAVRYISVANARRNPYHVASYTTFDVSEFLTGLNAMFKTAVHTSATIAIPDRAGAVDFSFYMRNNGVAPDALTMQVESPFDYGRNALLYIPDTPVLAPAGRPTEEYTDALLAEIRAMAMAAGGGAFLLFTSRYMMETAYHRLSPALPFLCLVQREGISKQEIMRQFKADGNAVLFATKSFWEGVDVKGNGLRLVVIDKVPFEAPSPLQTAREEMIQSQGLNPFFDLRLPEAVIELKQGFGRLIRSQTDRGVVALMDARVRSKGYGRIIVSALPPARTARRVDDVVRFFEVEQALHLYGAEMAVTPA